jgi:hypothetical protein
VTRTVEVVCFRGVMPVQSGKPVHSSLALRLALLCVLLALQQVPHSDPAWLHTTTPLSRFPRSLLLPPNALLGIFLPQEINGAPGVDVSHPCTSWCAEQLDAYQLELADLRDQVAALRHEARPDVSSEPASQPTDLGDGAGGARGRSPGTRSGLPLLPRPSAAQAATARSAERAVSRAPSDLRQDTKRPSGDRTQRALLQTGASSTEASAGGENALPCNKNEVGDIVAAGDKERVAGFTKLFSSNPLCAACIAPCAAKTGFDPVHCVYGCHHQMENACNTETGWERARPLLDQVVLGSRDSLIRVMAVVLTLNAALLHYPCEPLVTG